MTPASATVAGLVVGELSRVAWGLAQRGGLASVHPKRPDPNRTYPRLSLIVPARNEGLTIDACLTGAAGQDYPDLEILVVDDCSQDDTAARVRAFAAVDPRVRLVLFVDADTNLHQGAVTAVVDAARDGWIGLNDGPAEPTPVFSILTGQSLPTVWERIIQPGVLGMIMESMPVRLVNSALWPGIAIANGQFLLVRRDVYEVMGGYEAIRGEIAEDVMFARRAKGMGFRLRLADGSDLATTRMYTTPGALWEGWTKNLHVGSRLIPYLAVPGMGYLLATIIAPWVLLSTASRMGSQAW
ncbi:MAG: glycosyltransferase, partial [Chloroflexi bacterium]|nr:glycosyltransferase [Chloroflexota bacterium]